MWVGYIEGFLERCEISVANGERVLRSRMSGAILHCLLYVFVECIGTNLTELLTYHSTRYVS
jgi:hypothetical protein